MSEINTILIESTMVTLTTYLLMELINRKIKVIFCDENRNPKSELVSLYGSHNTSKRILNQVNWDFNTKGELWKMLIKQKIFYQIDVLKKCEKDSCELLYKYMDEVELYDSTNREGHAAKVYFNNLFGSDFNRNTNNNINAALDYGYTILLSAFNRMITAKGYITQLGIFHRNEFNYFNLSCDLMEPFRPIVDFCVYKNKDRILDKEYKLELVNLLNKKVMYDKKCFFLTDCINKYLNNIFDYLSEGIVNSDKMLYYYEL